MKKLFALLALLAMTAGFVSVNAWGAGRGGSTKKIEQNAKDRLAAPPTAAEVEAANKAVKGLRDRRFWN